MNCPVAQNIVENFRGGSVEAGAPRTGRAISPDGRQKTTLAKPDWLKMRLPKSNRKYLEIRGMMRELRLSTVCEEARCPNMQTCWGGNKKGRGSTATFMVMGDTCTRACRFCNVKSGYPAGWLDEKEPENLAKAIAKLGLDYAVITSVDRDDLPDGGAQHFARCIIEAKKHHPKLLTEVLIPDFQGDHNALEKIIQAKPTVIAHNVETTRARTLYVRDGRANFDQSLGVLRRVKERDPEICTKSAIMLGCGETEEDVIAAMHELRASACDMLTIGQYLQPTEKQMKVEAYVHPDVFSRLQRAGEEMGFIYVASGPFVRSSYRAGELFIQNLAQKKVIAP